MKKRKIIIAIFSLLIIIGIVTTVLIISNRYKTTGLNPANPSMGNSDKGVERGTLIVSNEIALPGDEVKIVVSIKDNPGILGMTLSVNYITSVLTLVDAESGDAVKDTLVFTKPGKYQNNCKFLWDGTEIKDDMIKDGDVLILTFKVENHAAAGEYPVLVSYEQDGIINNDLSVVNLDIIDGKVTIE